MGVSTILDILKRNYPMGIGAVEFLRSGGSVYYIVSGIQNTYLLKIIVGAFLGTIEQPVDNAFIDKQLTWLENWCKQY